MIGLSGAADPFSTAYSNYSAIITIILYAVLKGSTPVVLASTNICSQNGLL